MTEKEKYKPMLSVTFNPLLLTEISKQAMLGT